MSSVDGAQALQMVGGNHGKHFLNTCPTYSSWFEHFTAGCVGRMGQDICQDCAISLALMPALMSLFNKEWAAATTHQEQFQVAGLGAYSVICFCGSFQGLEVFLMDLHGLIKYANSPRVATECEHVIIPLLGHMKGEQGEIYYLTPLAPTMSSGLCVERWVHFLIEVQRCTGRIQGAAFTTLSEVSARIKDFEVDILDQIQLIQNAHPSIVPPDVWAHEEYGLSRSFRWSSTSEACSRGVDN